MPLTSEKGDSFRDSCYPRPDRTIEIPALQKSLDIPLYACAWLQPYGKSPNGFKLKRPRRHHKREGGPQHVAEWFVESTSFHDDLHPGPL
jgi:hypothetical protein